MWGYQNYAYLIANAYYNTGWLYKNAASAGVLQIAGDELSFRHAPSGTAGTTVTYTQPFTIKASGNVGIGTTGPTAKLQIGLNPDPSQTAESLVHLLSSTAPTTANGFNILKLDYLAGNVAGDAGATIIFNQGYHSGNIDYTAPVGALRGYRTGPNYSYGGGLQLLYQPDAGALGLLVGMTLTGGGNVGIGTTSPSRKLVVAQSNVTEPSGIDANTSILIKNNTWSGIQMLATEATGNFITFGDNVNGFAGRIQYSHATNAMQFETLGAERMRIDSSGNMTLLNATATNSRTIGITNSSGTTGWTLGNGVLSNTHQFVIYDNTAGAARMLIDSTGKVGIGTTSPSSYDGESDNLVIAEGVNGTNPTPGITIACLADQATTGRGAIRFADGAVGNAAYRGALEYNHDGDNMFFRTSGTIKMSIGSSGDVKITTNGKFLQGVRNTGSATIDMIGFVSGTDTLQIKGGTSGTANAISFYDTGGFLGTWYNSNFGIGTSSPGSKLMISDANNRNFYDAQFKIEGSGYTAAHYLDGTEYMIHQNSNIRRIRMMSGTSLSGVLLNPGATAWSSYSDESLKENLKPLDNVLDKIKDYRCVEYNFKNDKSKGKKIGFIAQDWEEDYPQIVDKDNKGLLDMKYTETIPVLLKAIQELKAEIEILKNK